MVCPLIWDAETETGALYHCSIGLKLLRAETLRKSNNKDDSV